MLEDTCALHLLNHYTLFRPGYSASLIDADSRRRHSVKLKLVIGVKNEWQDNIDLWPGVTNVHMCMYLILTPIPYSGIDMLNYMSLDITKTLLMVVLCKLTILA